MSAREKLLCNFTPDSAMKVDKGGVAYSLMARDYKDPQCLVMNEPCNWDETQIAPTLTARNAGGVSAYA